MLACLQCGCHLVGGWESHQPAFIPPELFFRPVFPVSSAAALAGATRRRAAAGCRASTERVEGPTLAPEWMNKDVTKHSQCETWEGGPSCVMRRAPPCAATVPRSPALYCAHQWSRAFVARNWSCDPAPGQPGVLPPLAPWGISCPIGARGAAVHLPSRPYILPVVPCAPATHRPSHPPQTRPCRQQNRPPVCPPS